MSNLNNLTARLIGLGMDPALAAEFSQATITFGASTVTLSPNTDDAADSGAFRITGGGALGTTRGADVRVLGNENASPGQVQIDSGAVAGNAIIFQVGDTSGVVSMKSAAGTTLWQFDNSGNLIFSQAVSSAGLSQSAATGLTAAGTTITDALQLIAVTNNVTTAGANTGVKFFDCQIGQSMSCRNGGANDLKLYPPTSSIAFNGGSAGASITLTTAAKQMATFTRVSATLMIGTVGTAT